MSELHRRLLTLAASGVLFLVGCSSEPSAHESPSPDVSVPPDVSGSPDPGPTILAAGTEALPAGTYLLDLDGGPNGDPPDIEITVPDGWANIEGWGIDSGGEHGDRWMGITFWDVDEVYKQPCDGSRTIQPGPTVAVLANALAEQPLRDATEPVDITVDGFQGLQMDWSVPADMDFSTCDDGYFDSWTAAAGSWNGGRYQQGPGQVDRLWILDVDGERLVVDAMYMPSTDARDREELWRVMESIRFGT